MKNLGIVGTGNIATTILNKFKFCNFSVKRIYVYDINPEAQKKFLNKFSFLPVCGCGSVLEVIKYSDVVIESASVDAVDEILAHIKKYKKKKYIILSVGGILKHFKFYQQLIKEGYSLYIPSGAIAGCDALSALRYGKIYSIHLKTTKPTSSLINAPYFNTHNKLYNKMLKSNQTVVFQGNVYDAVKNFPQNINVAATLAIFSGCPDKVKVSIVANKKLNKNIHEINILSSAGQVYIRTENLPLPENPKTSYLAALSVLPLLSQLL
ncbi:MAG: DUF108 domain-containing protein [Endomicrobia bacterium]|nr:DUF108 domain-containing protein [Endomicrobiia bacterium]MCX7716167.1 DUF108 domain-containing protein [Endomicrobiia bacterium]